MRLNYAALVILFACGSCSGPAIETQAPAASAFCRSISPDPSKVKYFYEDNPTYKTETKDDPFFQFATPQSQGLDPAPFQAGLKQLKKQKYPLSFLVMKNHKVVFERYINNSAVNDSNNVHSASKSILSALTGLALEHGYFGHIDETAWDLLPYWMSKYKRQITVRHLLNMASGMDWKEDDYEYWVEEQPHWIEAILSLYMPHIPGSFFTYTTGGTHLLGSILSHVTNQSLCDFAMKRLFKPLGIEPTHWGRDPQGYFSAGYSVYLTPRELAKFGTLYLNEGSWNGKQILSKAWVKQSTTTQIIDVKKRHYGHLWWLLNIDGHKVYKAWGYGGQFVYLIPQANMLVVLTNDTSFDHPEPNGDIFIKNYVLPALKPNTPLS